MVEFQPSKLATWVRFPSPAMSFFGCDAAGGFRIRGVFHNYLFKGIDVIQAAVLGAIRLRHFAFSLLVLWIRLQWVVP